MGNGFSNFFHSKKVVDPTTTRKNNPSTTKPQGLDIDATQTDGSAETAEITPANGTSSSPVSMTSSYQATVTSASAVSTTPMDYGTTSTKNTAANWSPMGSTSRSVPIPITGLKATSRKASTPGGVFVIPTNQILSAATSRGPSTPTSGGCATSSSSLSVLTRTKCTKPASTSEGQGSVATNNQVALIPTARGRVLPESFKSLTKTEFSPVTLTDQGQGHASGAKKQKSPVIEQSEKTYENVDIKHDTKKPKHSSPVSTSPGGDDLIVRARYDFQAVSHDDLSFKTNDRMKVDKTSLGADWWQATNLRTGASGYIPSNYVCKDDNSPRSQDWWFELDRKEADLMLLLPGNPNGTFLIRQASDKKSCVLSVRHVSPPTYDPAVRHYRIQRKDNDGDYFLSTKHSFADLSQLVSFYSQSDRRNGLCVKLTTPCPRLRPCETGRIQEVEIKRSAITMISRLGAGHFGEVWKGKLYNSADVAVKTLKPGSMTAEDFLEEAKTMHKMKHRKLVRLLAVCTQDEPILIVTELMAKGALINYLRADEARKLVKFPVMLKMAAQISDGMQYLEAINFIHRDLRAANVLVGEHHDVKVADFGLARVLNDRAVYKDTSHGKFPVKWTAPEAGLDREFSVKSDVWSFGVLLYELFTYGREPYPGFTVRDILPMLKNGYRMPKPIGHGSICTAPVYEMMLKCWRHTPYERPTFEFLNTFFDNYDANNEEDYCD